MGAVVTVWSDIHCPWAAVAVHRLRGAREAAGHDVVFDPRPWPLELINDRGVPYAVLLPEIGVLAAQEPSLFSALPATCRPSTMMPAFELVAAARRVHDLRIVEEVDYALRVTFFRHGTDISIRAGLEEALSVAARVCGDLDADEVMRVWEREPVRADVLADFERSRSLPIQGSPQLFWPDGSTTHNPGMESRMLRGIPRLQAADPAAPGRLLSEKLAAAGARG